MPVSQYEQFLNQYSSFQGTQLTYCALITGNNFF